MQRESLVENILDRLDEREQQDYYLAFRPAAGTGAAHLQAGGG